MDIYHECRNKLRELSDQIAKSSKSDEREEIISEIDDLVSEIGKAIRKNKPNEDLIQRAQALINTHTTLFEPFPRLDSRFVESRKLVNDTLSRLNAEYAKIHAKVLSLEKFQQPTNNRFNDTLKIMVTGLMKSGKSSFINKVFFGSDWLPTSPERCTARPTIIHYSKDYKLKSFGEGVPSTEI